MAICFSHISECEMMGPSLDFVYPKFCLCSGAMSVGDRSSLQGKQRTLNTLSVNNDALGTVSTFVPWLKPHDSNMQDAVICLFSAFMHLWEEIGS